MKRFLPLAGALAWAITSLNPLHAESADKEKLLRLINGIIEQQERLTRDVEALRALVGGYSGLEELEPMGVKSTMSEKVRTRLEDGLRAFERKKYDMAKELFQRAWEDSPNDATTNYNLGLAYYFLENTPLAKRFFKAALEINDAVPQASKVRAYVQGENVEDVTEEESPQVKFARTELSNLQKEAKSYFNSKSLSYPKRMAAAVKALRAMEEKAEEHEVLRREFYPEMADMYTSYDHFNKALKLFDAYEASMDGQVFPDGYYSKRLQVTERQKKQKEVLDSYVQNNASHDIGRKVNRDLKELAIFASQVDEFVKEADPKDPDFAKVCERLREYRWGDMPNRHVLVMNRYQDLIWSSLPGTVALERYQDTDGEKFFKNIAHLADQLELKQAEFMTVDLNVNGTQVPYVVMYTYVPKHEVFLVVRLARRDLM